MSTTVGQYGNFGSSLVLLAGIKAMGDQKTTLAWQTSTNILGETYADLGDNRSSVLNLTPKITQVSSWQSNITVAQTSLTMTSTALQQLVTMAQSLSTNLISMSGTTTSETVNSAAAEATSNLSAIANVLNTSNGSGYIFAGQNSTEPPIADSSSITTGALATQIASLVSNLSTSGASSVLDDATTASADNTSGTSLFSSDLSVSGTDASALQSKIVTGDDTTVGVGIVATQSVTSSSATSPSTGSPIRDLIRDMMIVSSLKGMTSSSTGFTDLVSKLRSSIQSTVSQLTDMETSVGVTQNTLTARSTLLTNMNLSLTTQLSNARDANYAVTASQLSDLNLRLQASYTLVADMKGMTLASYI